ncbi:MAG TPA: hypothetical protein VKA70_03195 [Blastocatellia bacterium]|nr:hypothetical protein [Blastocatellia bacterium]
MFSRRFWSPRWWAEKIRMNAVLIAHHRWAVGFVFVLELAGCTLLPIPIALVMVALVTAAPHKWFKFAMGATLGSTLGGLLLYAVGRLFFSSIGERLVLYYDGGDRWAEVVGWFNSEWGIFFIVLAGVTTGLFRFASLGAGFTAIDPVVFLAVLSVSRCARWIAECWTIKYVGNRVRNWPGHYFKYATVGVMLVLFATILVLSLAG